MLNANGADVVEHLLRVRPDMAEKIDKNGYSALHYACMKRRLGITRILLRTDLGVTQHFDNYGYTPLHLAAMNGDVAVLKEFMGLSLPSFQVLTKYEQETVFHLAVRFNHYHAFKYLAEVFSNTNLFHQSDRYGNTILHVAILRGHYHVCQYSNLSPPIDVYLFYTEFPRAIIMWINSSNFYLS